MFSIFIASSWRRSCGPSRKRRCGRRTTGHRDDAQEASDLALAELAEPVIVTRCAPMLHLGIQPAGPRGLPGHVRRRSVAHGNATAAQPRSGILPSTHAAQIRSIRFSPFPIQAP
jgi:hypothetical protein